MRAKLHSLQVQIGQTADTSSYYSTMTNDAVLPGQRNLGVQFHHATGERSLVGAILEDAVACALLRRGLVGGDYREGIDPWGLRLLDQWLALAWIRSEDTRWPFSFVNCCELLEIDPATIRELIMHGLAYTPTSAQEAREQWHCRVKAGKGSRTIIVKPKVRSAAQREREAAQYQERKTQRRTNRQRLYAAPTEA